jgi:predicted RNA-binding Zn ribbon-like protein
LCLDFVNTTGKRVARATRERLLDYQDVLVFCRRTGLLENARRRDLQKRSMKEPDRARAALARLLEVREVIHRLFVATLARTDAASSDVARFNSELAGTSGRRALAWDQGTPRWIWTPESNDLLQMLGPILFSAAQLLGSPDLVSVKQCGACIWLFLDTTRNHGRRWCKKTCGDRVKSRRYYVRHKIKRGRSASKTRSSPSTPTKNGPVS